MAVNIGPKIGIDGEAEYRKELKSIIQETKTLAAETNEAAAAFKNADDKEKAATEVTEKLNKQIEAQRKLVEKLEEGVKKSAQATGENSDETLKWKEQLAKAKAGLNTLEAQTKETTGEVQDLGEAEADTSDKTSIFGDVLKANLASELIKKGLQMTLDMIKDIGEMFVEAVKGAAEYADEISTLEKTTGLSTDALQEYKYMANLLDVDLETITGSMTKMEKAMSSDAKAFEKLGVATRDENGELRDANAVYADTLEALRKIENPVERDTTAMELFGKSAKDLNPLIETSAEDLDALRKEAHKVGAVMDKDTLSALNDVNDSMDRMGLTWDSIKKTLGAKIGIAILPDMKKLTKLFQDFTKTGDIQPLIDGIFRALKNAISKAKTQIPKLAKGFGKTIGSILGNLPELIAAGAELGAALLKGLVTSIPEMGKAIAQAFEKSQLSDYTVDAIAKIDELGRKIEEIPNKTDRMASSLGEVNAKQKEAEHWVKIFDELYQKTNPTAEETAKLQTAVEKLNTLYPELGLAIDEETGKWNLDTQAIKDNIEALSARYRAEAYYAAASDALQQIAMLEAETRALRQNNKALKNAIENKDAVARVEREQYLALQKLEYAYSKGAMDIGTYTQALKDMGYESRNEALVRMNELTVSISKNTEELNNMRAEYEAGAQTLAEADAKIAELNGDVEWLFSQGADWGAKAEAIGEALPAGVAKGIKKGIPAVEKTAGTLIKKAINQMKDVAQIASPSKVTEDIIGKNLGLGVIKGWDDVMDPTKLADEFSLTPAFEAMTSSVTNTTNNTTNMGGVSVNVYAREGMNIDELTDAIMLKMQRAVNGRKAVFSNEFHI